MYLHHRNQQPAIIVKPGQGARWHQDNLPALGHLAMGLLPSPLPFILPICASMMGSPAATRASSAPPMTRALIQAQLSMSPLQPWQWQSLKTGHSQNITLDDLQVSKQTWSPQPPPLKDWSSSHYFGRPPSFHTDMVSPPPTPPHCLYAMCNSESGYGRSVTLSNAKKILL